MLPLDPRSRRKGLSLQSREHHGPLASDKQKSWAWWHFLPSSISQQVSTGTLCICVGRHWGRRDGLDSCLWPHGAAREKEEWRGGQSLHLLGQEPTLTPLSKPAVPNLFCTRDWFHGKDNFFMDWVFHGLRGGGWFWDDSSALHLLCTLPLSLLLHQLHLRSSSIRFQRLGTPVLNHTLLGSTLGFPRHLPSVESPAPVEFEAPLLLSFLSPTVPALA